MKTTFYTFGFLGLLACVQSPFCGALAQGTSFTYQGQLADHGTAAAGLYDLQFTVYDSPAGGLTIAGPLTSNPTPVSNGLFTVTLDFGGNVFSGAARWLEIAVRSNGTAVAYQILSPRQLLTAAPYAITAGNVTGVLPGNSLSGAYPGAVTLANPANIIAGDGSGLHSLNATQISGTIPATALDNAWKTAGNTGADPGHGSFLGTLDNQPLELKANALRALRIEPNTNGAPNVIGGAPVNFVDPGIVGATIAGGGTVSGAFYLGAGSNHVGAIFGTIAGGRMHTILADHGFIGGGISNSVMPFAYDAVIGGGVANFINTNAYDCVIAGGYGNSILNDLSYSSIGGGLYNQIGTNSNYAVIGGGVQNATGPGGSYMTIGGGGGNLIGLGDNYTTISGGGNNSIQANARSSTIGGGAQNTIAYGAIRSTIAGGINQSIGTNSHHSAISGGEANTILSDADHSFIAGGNSNSISAAASFAAGTMAQASHPGSFVWSDLSSLTPFASTATNQFNVRAAGGVRLVTAGAGLNVDGPTTVAGTVSANAFQGDGSGLYNVGIGSPPPPTNYVFAYNGVNQNVTTANVYQDVTFGSDAQLSGWTHTSGTAPYTCPQSGLYLVQYSAELTTTGVGTNASLQVTLNGAAVSGSRLSMTFSAANQLSAISKSLIVNANASDALTVQFTGAGTGVRFAANGSLTITQVH